ncbi:MAG: MoxR family ATPase [Chromatiales bacterium]|jgi:MoxR-like ATPase|nr:MoxR family ATPase [Chromatiales bacterium]
MCGVVTCLNFIRAAPFRLCGNGTEDDSALSFFSSRSATTPVHPGGADFEQVVARLSEVIVGKEGPVRLALACLLARGHLLIEDLPGVGKTTLSQALGRCLGLAHSRVQFTSDLLPADVLGVSIFERETSTFQFHAGPVFTQLLLADEVNRATPKTQSALLEAMEERQVTVDGHTRPLPRPFFVIATQNPARQVGTFPLPESQLDRFLMRIELGYPSPTAERELLRGTDRREVLAGLAPALTVEELLAAQERVPHVHVSDALLDYLQELLAHTRQSPDYVSGLSPRAGLALLRAAQSWACLHERKHVVPEDLQEVFASVVGHRLVVTGDLQGAGATEVAAHLLRQVPIP